MNTGSGILTGLRDHLLGFVCDIRGHAWAGARQFEAHSDGLLLCVRCGFASDKAPQSRRLIALH